MRNTSTLIVTFLLSCTSAICSSVIAAHNGTHLSRAADTCADPSLATVFIEAFSTTRAAHIIRAKIDVVAYDSGTGTSDNFQFQGPSFRAWTDPQDFTVPFHSLGTPSGNDATFLPEVDGNPPSASGYHDQAIVGYAYATQVCGSVPLYSASNAASSDHWWTTSQSDHSALLKLPGWVDAGIPFYVLPLDCSCSA